MATPFRPAEPPDLVGFARNAMLDFSPIERAIGNINAEHQRGIENRRVDEQLGFQRQRLGMEQKRFDRDNEKTEVERIGRMAQVIDGEKDPNRRAAMIQRMYQGSPRMVDALKQYGVDPNDHVNVPKFLMAQAGAYDPLGEQKSRAEIARIGASTDLARSQADYYRAKARPEIPQPVAGNPDLISQGYGIDENGNMVAPGAVPTSSQPSFAGLPAPNMSRLPEVMAPGVSAAPGMPPPMRLGGPTDDIERTTLPDQGGRFRNVAPGVQVAQAGGGAPPLMDQARQRAFGPAGVTSPDVPGIVTDAGRNRRTDVPATRELQGQRAFEAASPDQQQRLLRLRQEQQFWSSAYGRPPRAGYYYGPDGRELPLTDKNYKGDREAQAVALMNMSKIEDASKRLLASDYITRTAAGALNIGELGQAFADMKQGALGIAYALSGKQVAVAEMKNFIEAYGPVPGDGADRIKQKTQRMREFYHALLTASRGGESYETAFARAMAATGLKNPDGSPVGQPAAASAGRGVGDPPRPNDVRGLSTDELIRRLNGGR